MVEATKRPWVLDAGNAFPRHPGLTGGGMSLRDWLAGQALAGLLASTANPRSSGPAQFPDEEWAEMAFQLADAMLAAREAQS